MNTSASPVSDDELVAAAASARENAYCRYSDFSVGAALIDDQGQLHIGCNIENAAYPLGNCAEASAIAAMVLAGGQRIARIAVVGGKGDASPCTPCGGCRQRIHEFADGDTVIIAMESIQDGAVWRHYSIAELLPAGFRLD